MAFFLLAVFAVLAAIEGTWAVEIHSHWSFIVLTLLAIFLLGAEAAGDFRHKRTVPLLSHAGLLLVLAGGLLGAAGLTDVTIQVAEGRSESVAIDSDGGLVHLPWEVSLHKFTIDYYEDGTRAKQYTSELEIGGKTLKTSVNHPARYKGWRIYQSCWGEGYSVLKLVRNPWLALLLLGALLLVSGAALSLAGAWSGRKILVPALVLAAVFSAISIARINFGALPPALRSLWFAPHLAAYMLAYAILALSLLSGIGSTFSGRIPEGLTHRLLTTAQSGLLIGMICGAVWAQQAWGSYWSWDPKECWAAATWALTLAASGAPLKCKRLALTLIILAFLAMNVTWYGINYLPSSTVSMHTYNRANPALALYEHHPGRSFYMNGNTICGGGALRSRTLSQNLCPNCRRTRHDSVSQDNCLPFRKYAKNCLTFEIISASEMDRIRI